MAAHVKNIKKIMDDLQLNLSNIGFNDEENGTLSRARAVDRHGWIREGSIAYNCHFCFREGEDIYEGLTQIEF